VGTEELDGANAKLGFPEDRGNNQKKSLSSRKKHGKDPQELVRKLVAERNSVRSRAASL
jgi:hypothetical protein